MYLDSMADHEGTEDHLEDLNDLIRYLEKERDDLKACVENAAKEWEFSEAKAYAKEHSRVAGRLHVLKNLKDPFFEERASYYHKLVFLEQRLKNYPVDSELRKRWSEEINEINRILDELEKRKHFFIDTQYIDDAIFQLVEGTVENFKLCISRSEGVVFDFTCDNHSLQICLSYNKGALFRSMKNHLRRIGFLKAEGKRRFIYNIDITHFKDAQKIKQLLSVAMFDVFGRTWIDSPAQLEINHKTETSQEKDDE